MTTAATLAASGLRATPIRTRIFELFDRVGCPLTAEDVRSRIKGSDKVTVYRTIDRFVSAGLLAPVMIESGKAYYERTREHHHHIVCTDCGTIEDIHVPHRGMERAALAQSQAFNTISRHSLEFFGMCDRCATKSI